jgi:predicted nucleic acid-binding protein
VKRFLLDTNVVLDIVLDRRPHSTTAGALWGEIEKNRAEGLIAAHAVTTIYYLLRQGGGRRVAETTCEKIMRVMRVAPVNDAVIREALALGWDDFEDAVTAVAGHNSGCDAIVTRDTAGFRGSPTHVVNAKTAVTWIRSERGGGSGEPGLN